MNILKVIERLETLSYQDHLVPDLLECLKEALDVIRVGNPTLPNWDRNQRKNWLDKWCSEEEK